MKNRNPMARAIIINPLFRKKVIKSKTLYSRKKKKEPND